MAQFKAGGASRSLKKVPPVSVLLFGVLAASTSSILIRFAQQEVDSLVIAAYRLSLAAIILLPIRLRSIRTASGEDPFEHLGLMLLSGLFLAIHFASWISSLEFTNVTSSVVIVQTSPLFVSLLSPVLLGERPARTTWIGLGIAILGSALIAASDLCPDLRLGACLNAPAAGNPSALAGNALALLGALSGACYLMIGRRLRPSIDLLTYITWVYGFAAVSLLILVLLLRRPILGFSPTTYIWLLLLAVFPQLLAHSSYNWALRFLSAASVSIGLLGEPIAASILAFLFLNETPGVALLAGATLVLGGIILAVIKRTLPPEIRSTPTGIQAQ